MIEEYANIKCPGCGAALVFSPEKGKMVCSHCGNEYDPAAVEQPRAAELHGGADAADKRTAKEYVRSSVKTKKEPDNNWNASGFNGDSRWLEALSAANCSSCGAVIVTDTHQLSTQCPWCGNQTIAVSKIEGSACPDYVLPFKITKEEAISKLEGYFAKRRMLPRAFTRKKHLQEIHGIYVPFFLYSGRVEGEAEYRAEKTETEGRSGNYILLATSVYNLIREGTLRFSRIPADASRGMPNDLMDSIEPFQFNELKSFAPAYLAGFEAEVNSDLSADCARRAERRAKETMRRKVNSTLGSYDRIGSGRFTDALYREKVQYALLPVWMLTTVYGGVCYNYAINGQTGKAAGNIPIGGIGVLKLWLINLIKPALITLACLIGFMLIGFLL